MRGATHALIAILDSNIYFNPRAPCGARPGTMAVKHGKRLFQSTHPSRGATADKVTERLRHEISIHAPHAGRDTRWSSVGSARADFNPRAPCGARRHPQSHPAGSGAISIHAPRAGATGCTDTAGICCLNFNPRAPCGRDYSFVKSCMRLNKFQSTRPVRSRLRRTLPGHTSFYFNPRAPCGRDPNISFVALIDSYFNPRAPCGRDSP